ncbi:lipopolysaccharide-induced tumor necrosis factor-alpha factor homolog [Condylostylus longicornis]|uniref:lipopolysaccharide-induced tumor necrosis factor-alpha factor homolog n=1 Tax=Condylostylus longicornis TaxID=2530218 RepID=UPI00244DC8E7|nr:lipopolysaccharide-induced tumor necrosis factor-alpha factor homolog [Condylostylus longicornis]
MSDKKREHKSNVENGEKSNSLIRKSPPPSYKQSTTKTVYIQPVALGSKSQSVICPACRETIVTIIEYETSSKTHYAAIALCCFFWPIAYLPYCIDSCKNANHYCPNCESYIGTYAN